MNKVALSIGSNSEDSANQMNMCIAWLSTLLKDVVTSCVYETPALNGKDKNYLNAVVVGYTESDYDSMRDMAKRYEYEKGRTPESKYQGCIPIDVDVVMWNDDILRAGDFSQSYFQIGWNEIITKEK